MQRLGVAVRVQPIVLSLGAQCLGVATSKVAPLGDRHLSTIEASASSSARCDRSRKQIVIVFVIVFVIVLVIVLWDSIHLPSLPPYSSSTFLLCARSAWEHSSICIYIYIYTCISYLYKAYF